MQRTSGLVVADVGANVGQTIGTARASLDAPVIHAFEPGLRTFEELQTNCGDIEGVTLSNCAVGSAPGVLELNESTHLTMSSVLEKGPQGWGAVTAKRQVEVVTLDRYCEERSIAALDVVKSDTQGYDLEVLKGASGLFGERRIRFVLLEIIFGELYEGLPDVSEIFAFMSEIFAFMELYRFDLVSFYEFRYRNRRASWADALFVRSD